MRKIALFFSLAALGAGPLRAQTVGTFDSLSLATIDTYYVNYSAPGADVGFNSGLAHFPCMYDTSFGGYWSTGFAYSNKTDSVTSGYTNEYAAKTAIGYAGSAKYAVAYCSNPATFAYEIRVNLIGSAVGKPVSGFQVTNSTYAYNSMKNGDGFAKKFGGTTGNDPDWFKLVVRGYLMGALKPDTVAFYLADFRFANNDSDYIVNTWQWVNLLPIGDVDSLQFELSSTDNGSSGMYTPAYFCIDNFTTNETGVGVKNITPIYAAKLYPNPTSNQLNIELQDRQFEHYTIFDALGNQVYYGSTNNTLNTLDLSNYAPGIYQILFTGNGKQAFGRFIKQ